MLVFLKKGCPRKYPEVISWKSIKTVFVTESKSYHKLLPFLKKKPDSKNSYTHETTKKTQIKKKIERIIIDICSEKNRYSSDKGKGEISYVKVCFVISHMVNMLEVVLLNDQRPITCSASRSRAQWGDSFLKAPKSTTFVRMKVFVL